MIDPILKDQLIRDEGLRLNAYKDSVGLWTIGVGHLLGLTQRMLNITNEEAMALFAWDVAVAEAIAVRLFPSLPAMLPARRRVLINMAFNLGGKKLAGFVRFRNALKEENYPAAAAAMMDSKWAKQVGERAKRLRDAMLSGSD